MQVGWVLDLLSVCVHCVHLCVGVCSLVLHALNCATVQRASGKTGSSVCVFQLEAKSFKAAVVWWAAAPVSCAAVLFVVALQLQARMAGEPALIVQSGEFVC